MPTTSVIECLLSGAPKTQSNSCFLGAKQKLYLDFAAASSMCPLVEDEAHIDRIIGDLLVRAGQLMEDECVPLIMRLPADRLQMTARIDRLRQVAADLSALANAADVLVRASNEQARSRRSTGLRF